METSRKMLFACALSLLALAQTVSAQGVPALTTAAAETASEKKPDAPAAAEKGAAGKEAAAAAPQAGSERTISRWFEIQAATISTRYVFADNRAGQTLASQVQHQQEFVGRFKFDAKGAYSINAGFFTGKDGGWNDTGLGRGVATTNLYLKHLFFSAKPVRGVEFQYGALDTMRGVSTAITSYGAPSPMGQRLILRRPEQLFFDEVAVTYGYMGGSASPNFSKRAHLLKKSNYHQFLASKRLGRRAVVSADYTFDAGVETMREAVHVRTGELRVVDSIRFESYQRVDVNPDFGFALGGEKTLFDRLGLGAGYARIDRRYGNFNDDAFFNGKRVYASASYRISREFSVSTLWNRAVANDYDVTKRTHFHLAFSYNLLKSLQRTGIF